MSYWGVFNTMLLIVLIIAMIYVMAKLTHKNAEPIKIFMLLPAYYFGIAAPESIYLGKLNSFIFNFSLGLLFSMIFFRFFFITLLMIFVFCQNQDKEEKAKKKK